MIRKAIIVGMTLGAVGISVAFFLTVLFILGYADGSFEILLTDGMLGFAHGIVPDYGGWYIESRHKPLIGPLGPFRLYFLPQDMPRPGGGGIAVPLWALFALFAPYPTLAFIRGPFRKWRRKKKGLCLSCGYDLTGNVTGVCSECGISL